MALLERANERDGGERLWAKSLERGLTALDITLLGIHFGMIARASFPRQRLLTGTGEAFGQESAAGRRTLWAEPGDLEWVRAHRRPRSDQGDIVLRILLVEDNAELVGELSSTLEELAPAKIVGTAQAQDEACRWMDARTQACDVAIIDVFLKRGNGLAVLEHIATYEQPPRRVILTNYATRAIRQRCRQLGADAVFDKSTEIEQLVDWLAEREVGH